MRAERLLGTKDRVRGEGRAPRRRFMNALQSSPSGLKLHLDVNINPSMVTVARRCLVSPFLGMLSRCEC